MPNVPYDYTQVSPYAQNAYRTDDYQISKYPYESKGESHKQSWQSWVFPTILVLLIVIILLLCSSSGLIAKVLPFFNNTASNESMSKSLTPGINFDDISNWNKAFSWGDHREAGYLTKESDPLYSSSPAAKITEDDLKKIQESYSWGNHTNAGYLKSFTETDPKYSSSPASSITASDISKWNSKENAIPTGTTSQYFRGDKTWQTFPTCTGTQALAWNGTSLVCVNFPTYTETDPIFVASPANSITNTMISNWNTAYSWGNHASAGYLTTETDPIFNASPASSITNTMISNWNTAFSWGNHATAGYLTSETDPVFTASVAASITTADISNWNNKENAIALGTTSQFFRGDKTWQTIPTCTGNNRLTWNGTGFVCAPTGTLTTETDPIFNASPAGSITNTMISNWNTAFSWGNHATAGYLTSESDPIFSASPANSITNTMISNWNTAFSWGDHASAGYLTTETDPIFNASPASSITNTMISNWNTAFSWGDHASAGYLTTETDPIFNASPAGSITNTMISNWNTAFSWGDHATAGYLTAESDPIFAASPANSITNTMISNWNTAYSWGNHATAGYLTTETDPIFNASPAGSITNTMISNWNTAFSWGNHATAGYLTSESDPIFSASPANSITNTMISNWNTAFSWGDHASAGYLTTETDPIFNASPAGSITNTMISNWNTAYSWGNHATAGYLTSESDPIFSASAAASITAADITNWNNKENAIAPGTTSQFFRGDKTWQTIPTCTGNDRLTWNGTGFVCAPTGTLTTETDPIFNASPASSITNTMISNWNTAFSWGNHATAGYLTSETDPVFTASVAASITAADISNWNNKENTITPGTTSQFFRGDKTWQTIPTCTGNNRLTWNGTGFVCVPTGTLTTETDPIFSASPASSITNTMISNWNNKENPIAPGTTSQFFRGDKTWQTIPTCPINNALLWNGTNFICQNFMFNTTNLRLGTNAGQSLTSGAHNTFIGIGAGSANTTGNANIFVGASSGGSTTTGSRNTFIGYFSGSSTTTGSENIFIGYLSGSLSNGNSNISIGNLSGYLSNGNSNISIGNTSGYRSNGDGNVFIGGQAGRDLESGSYNVFLGTAAGMFSGSGGAHTSSTNSIFIGYNSMPQANGQTNQIAIGDSVIGAGSNTTTIGNTNITATYLRGSLIASDNITNGTTRVDIAGTGTGWAVCHSGSATATDNVNLVDCTSTPSADYMEMYPVESNAQIGDILMASNDYVLTQDNERIVKLVRANAINSHRVIGVMSDRDKAGDFNSIGHNINASDNPQPIALSGRVYVNIDPSSPDIEPGDMITISSTPGKGTKLTGSGFIVGKALEAWSSTSGQTKVMIYIMNFYYNPSTVNEYFTLSGTTLNTDYSLVVNGSITANSLSLASGKFTVASNGNTVIDAILQANQAVIRNLMVDKLSINTTPIVGDPVVGSGTITAGQTRVVINNSNVQSTSKIFITLTSSSTQVVSVINKTPGVSFEVSIPTQQTEDITFDYWIIN